MNVAYLLVSSAWLAGQAPPATTTAPPATMAAPIVTSGAGYGGAGYGGAGCGCDGCNSGGDACCGSGGGGFCHRFKNKMRGMFKRGGSDCGCAAPAATSCCSAPAVTTASCGCGTTDCCESGGKHKFRNKMRGMFKRGGHGGGDCGCASDCGSGCGGVSGGCGAPYGGVQGGVYGAQGGTLGERIPAPKDGNLNKMPKGGSGEPPANGNKTGFGSQVQINVAPATPIPAAAPALEAAPTVPAPAANTEERPF